VEGAGLTVGRIGRVGILPLGKAPEPLSKAVAAQVTSRFGLKTEILPARKAPTYSFDKRRRQYDAAMIIHRVESGDFPGFDKLICIVGVDLFVPIFTHVLGQAREGGKCAVISLHRLTRLPDRSPAPMPLILERVSKVALHELGHLFDLVHCMDHGCLMHFSGDLEDLDRTRFDLCDYCGRFWTDALRRHDICQT
jgi:archaemetzincin